MFEKWYALDPGSFEFRMYDYSNEVDFSIRSVIAYKDHEIVGMAHDALEYVYHQNKNTQVKYPIQKGVLKGEVSPLINACLKELNAPRGIYKPCLRIYVPVLNSAIQKKWLMEIQNTNIKKVDFVSEIDLLKAQPHIFHVHTGHSYTRIFISMNGKPIMDKTIDFAGKHVDEAIQSMVTQKTQCLISNEDARALKEAASKHLKENKNATLSCFAMNRYQQYQRIELKAMDVWPCMESIEQQIVLWIKHCFEKLTIEIKEKVLEEGIHLSGGMANCFGLQQYLDYELKCPVICTSDSSFYMIEQMKGWK